MTCICGHHEKAHLSDIGLCAAPEGCNCNHFRKAPAVHDGLSIAMLRARDFAIVPSVPTRKQFSVALQALVDSHDGESVEIEHAERIALYLDAIYAKMEATQ